MLPKLRTRVRFPSLALEESPGQGILLACPEASLSGVLRAISREWFLGGALLTCGRPSAQVRLAFEGADEAGGEARRGPPGWRPATPNAGSAFTVRTR